MLRTLILGFVVVIARAGIAEAQEPEFWPGVTYDPAVPTMEQVLGHAPGASIVSHVEMLRYLQTLVEARPSQIRMHEYGRTWEDRSLVYVVVGSAENIARAPEIQRDMKRLSDPRTIGDADARAIIENQPAITWLAYGVHGNEISSPDAGLYTAYHLLAARNDELVDTILAESLVIIVPTQNPDGRDRFVHHYRMNEGIAPRPHPAAAEHDEPWPGGRTNHYYFDLNRDWLALTQPETRGHVRAYQEWFPQIFVDLHEMGGNSTYYFAPEARPYNPHITSAQREALDLYGRNNARWFDEFGFLYFTREVYDAFYPGYGASWPLFHGSIATTYEQASARGLVFARNDGTQLHFRDGIRHHFVASIATAETTARNRKRQLESFWEYRRSAIVEGRTEPVKAFVVVNEGNTSAVQKLAGIFAEHGVEVSRALANFEGCGRSLPRGSLMIDLAQPTKRLVRTLLDPDVPMEPDFLAEQERRRRKNLPDEIYDVTGWSLAQMFDVEAVTCSDVPTGDFEPAGDERIRPGSIEGGRAELAYLVPWGTAASGRLLSAALEMDLWVLSADKTIQQSGRTYPTGTLIFMVDQNPPDLHETLERLARESGAEIIATDTGWVEGGINFGSNNAQHVRKPEVALAWDRPTSAYSAGATRFVLEGQYGYPVTPVRTRRLATTDLTAFDVVILPEGDYESVLDDDATVHLKEWIEDGGTLIGLGTALGYLTESELLATTSETQAKTQSEKSTADEGDTPEPKLLDTEADYLRAIEPEEERPDPVAGVVVRAELDPDHWMNAGMDETVHALVRGRAIYTPLTLDEGQNPAIFSGPDDLVASGYLWEENRNQLAYKPLTMVQAHGRGLVIGFTADPNYRAYLDGLNTLFLNAVFRGPARARPPVLR